VLGAAAVYPSSSWAFVRRLADRPRNAALDRASSEFLLRGCFPAVRSARWSAGPKTLSKVAGAGCSGGTMRVSVLMAALWLGAEAPFERVGSIRWDPAFSFGRFQGPDTAGRLRGASVSRNSYGEARARACIRPRIVADDAESSMCLWLCPSCSASFAGQGGIGAGRPRRPSSRKHAGFWACIVGARAQTTIHAAIFPAPSTP